MENLKQQKPFNLVYEIVQDCPFKCAFCLRRFQLGEKLISPNERKLIVDKLKGVGMSRMTVTGGEPLLLGKEVFEFLEYVHRQQIHTSLSTTGYKLTEPLLQQMDKYLDHLLISIHSLDKKEWAKTFGEMKLSDELYQTVLALLKWIRSTGIILEVCTVVHRKNIDTLLELGRKIADINPAIIWRIETYYAIGIGISNRKEFEIDDHIAYQIKDKVEKEFNGVFKNLYFSERNRTSAPDIMITPTGEMVTTANHQYTSLGNILDFDELPEFNMRRSWDEYKKYCRNWNW